jgi:phospholipid transport system substrate-binding protein
MFGRRGIWLCAMVVVFAIGQARASEPATPQAFIQSLVDDAILQLTDPAISIDEQEQRFRKIMSDYVAFNSIARWVLGRHWRKADDAQQARYFKVFEDLMVATYAHRFRNYGGEKLEIAATRDIEQDQWLVQSKVRRLGADKELRVDWRVRRTDERFRVIDIMVEGLSMAQTQRSEFASVMRNNGGDLDALLLDLETRLEKARKDRDIAINEASK